MSQKFKGFFFHSTKSPETSAKNAQPQSRGHVYIISISFVGNRAAECLLLYNHMHFYAFIYKSHQITVNHAQLGINEPRTLPHTVSKPASQFCYNAHCSQMNLYVCVVDFTHMQAKGMPWFRFISTASIQSDFIRAASFTVRYFALCKYMCATCARVCGE